MAHSTNLVAHDNGEGSSHSSDGVQVSIEVEDESDIDDPLATHVQDQDLLDDDFLRDDTRVQ